jgi:hypothetical protein
MQPAAVVLAGKGFFFRFLFFFVAADRGLSPPSRDLSFFSLWNWGWWMDG